jgi:hypothetical protein
MSDSDPRERARQVLERNRDELMRRYRAIGTGLGRKSRDDPAPVIVVYVESSKDVPAGAHAVEGVEIKFVATGEVRFQ